MANNDPTIGRLESLIRKTQAERQAHIDAIAAIDASFAGLGMDPGTAPKKRGRPKGAVNKRRKATPKTERKGKRKGWTPARKKAHSKMMKKRWAGKKKKAKTKTKTRRKMTQTPKLIAARKMQGQYMGRLRKLKASDKAKVQAAAKREGVKAAVKLADQILK